VAFEDAAEIVVVLDDGFLQYFLWGESVQQ
jgi:hypothetical protein